MSSSTAAGAPVRLAQNEYGKGKVCLLRLYRNKGKFVFSDLTVRVTLQGDFETAYTEGSNAKVLPTDTMKNTVYALSKLVPVDPMEKFAAALCEHFLSTQKQVSGVKVVVERKEYQRVRVKGIEHEHTFRSGSDAVHGCVATQKRGATPEITGFVHNLHLIKTTQSGFEGYIRDKYTTLQETRDRIVNSRVDADWKFCPHAVAAGNIDYNAVRARAETGMVEEFAGPAPYGVYSPSVQQTLYDMGARVIKDNEPVASIYLYMPNLHFIPFDLAKLGLKNENEVFFPSFEPHGIITATVERVARARL